MHRLYRSTYIFSLLASVLAAGSLLAAEPNEAETQALRQIGRSLLEGISKQDEAAVAALWTPQGNYVDETGNVLKGADLTKLWGPMEGKPRQVSAKRGALRFVRPEVAIEDGTLTILPPPAGHAADNRYTVVYVKNDGKWLIDSLRTSPLAIATPADHLQELGWLVGEWSGSHEGRTVHVTCHWGANRNYLLRMISVTEEGRTTLAGTQRIGWDPLAGKAHSWFFDADGGYAEGVWTHEGDAWSVASSGVTAEGEKATAKNVYRHPKPDQLSMESTGAKIGDASLPDFKIEMVRQASDVK